MANNIVIVEWNKDGNFNVTLPSGSVKVYSMIQTAMRVAANFVETHEHLILQGEFIDRDREWATLFINGERQ